MPLTDKGRKIMSNLKKEYGKEKSKEVFYALKNSHKITGVDKGFYGHMEVGKPGSIKGETC